VLNFLNFTKISLLLLAIACISSTALAQSNGTIDSLNAQLEKEGNSATRIDIQNQIAYEFLGVDDKMALSFASESFTSALELKDSLRIVQSGKFKSSALRRVEKIVESIQLSEWLLAIARRNNFKEEIKGLLNPLAIAYTLNAEYDHALAIHFESLVIREAEGNKNSISITLNNIGLVYFKLRNYEKAIEFYQRALALTKEVDDKRDVDRILINIGLCYNQLKNFNEARKYINQGLNYCLNNCSDRILIEAEFGLGVSFFGSDETDRALHHFEKSYSIAKQIDDKRFQAENLVYLGKIAISNKENDRAEEFLQKAEALADSAHYNQLLMDTYKQFSALFNQEKNYENASLYQNKYISLKDSLIGESLVKNIAKIQSNFEERANIATIAEKDEDLARQRNLNIAIGIIALLAGLLVFVLYRGNAITRKVNSALSDAKGIIETQNHRLQNINRELDAKVKEKTADLVKANEELDVANKSLVRVNDELDNFIYKTSHDIRGPLASLKGICSVALMDVKDTLALDYLTKLDVSSGRLNVILTRLLIVNQINHAIVGREPIDFSAIVDDVLLLERKKGMPPRLEIRKDIEKNIHFLSDKDLVRIILENLIDNSIKFYNDSDRIQPFVHIKVTLHNDKDVLVSVIDNGIGIAEAKPDKIFQMFSRASERSGTGGIGLYLSKLASEKLGGQINLRNTPEGYTEFYVSFPLKMQLV
jgi:signal transduction histidine kinase